MLLNHFLDFRDTAFCVGLAAFTAIAASLYRFLDLHGAPLVGEKLFKLFPADRAAIAQNRHGRDSPLSNVRPAVSIMRMQIIRKPDFGGHL